MMKYISTYLDESLVEKIDKLAEKEERSRSWFIKKILTEFLEKNK